MLQQDLTRQIVNREDHYQKETTRKLSVQWMTV